MNWREAIMTLQLLADERVGAPRRRPIYEEKAREDAAFEAASRSLPRGTR